MAFSEHDHMVEALTSDRPDEPLCISILPGRPCRGRPVPNAHGTDPLDEARAINTVPITDHITRCLSPAKRLGELLCNPLGGRLGCHSQPEKFPPRALLPNS